MKTQPRCDLKDCLDTGCFHPVAVFKTLGGYVRTVVGIKVCLKHKRIIKELEHVLGDGGARIVEALGGESVVFGKHLDWCALDSQEARDYVKTQAASAPS